MAETASTAPEIGGSTKGCVPTNVGCYKEEVTKSKIEVNDIDDRDKGYVVGSSKESLGSFEVRPARDVVAHRASQSGGAKHTRAHKMEKTTVTRTFSLKGDASVRGGIEMELTWQPFAAE